MKAQQQEWRMPLHMDVERVAGAGTHTGSIENSRHHTLHAVHYLLSKTWGIWIYIYALVSAKQSWEGKSEINSYPQRYQGWGWKWDFTPCYMVFTLEACTFFLIKQQRTKPKEKKFLKFQNYQVGIRITEGKKPLSVTILKNKKANKTENWMFLVEGIHFTD